MKIINGQFHDTKDQEELMMALLRSLRARGMRI